MPTCLARAEWRAGFCVVCVEGGTRTACPLGYHYDRHPAKAINIILHARPGLIRLPAKRPEAESWARFSC
jgi:hypothetical protein